MGVRTVVLRDGRQVLLVRHTYRAGWHLPGGGVDPGETPLAAAIRELREETGVVADATPALVSAHLGRYLGLDNYVLVYAVTSFRESSSESPEIAEIGWFEREALPEGTTDSTRRRIAEFLDRAVPDPRW